MKSTKEVLFSETQYFRQWWVWMLLIGVSVLPLYGIYRQIILGEPWGTNPVSNAGLLIFAAFILLLFLLFINMRLVTVIREDGIYYRFYPFHTSMKFIAWEETDKLYLRKYKPLKEYGGWGLRYGFGKKGRAVNVSGNKGLQIEFKNGNKLLIGTQKPRKMDHILAEKGKLTAPFYDT